MDSLISQNFFIFTSFLGITETWHGNSENFSSKHLVVPEISLSENLGKIPYWDQSHLPVWIYLSFNNFWLEGPKLKFGTGKFLAWEVQKSQGHSMRSSPRTSKLKLLILFKQFFHKIFTKTLKFLFSKIFFWLFSLIIMDFFCVYKRIKVVFVPDVTLLLSVTVNM